MQAPPYNSKYSHDAGWRIIADACNNIFVGEGNGIIKVYNFNGITFSDAPADIAIPGFSGKAVYDLSYDESKKLIYAVVMDLLVLLMWRLIVLLQPTP